VLPGVDDIWLTSALTAQGYDPNELARLLRRGELARVRRGAYASAGGEDLVREEKHRRLIYATAPQLFDGSVVSHGSAAALHRLPVWAAAIERVHVTRSRSGHGKRRRLVHAHSAPLDETDIVLVDGIAVTSIARTVLDLARTLPMEQAVALGDRAVREGLSPDTLAAGLLRMERWPGVRKARRTVDFLDPRSESVGESVSRVRLHLDGLLAPELQQEIIAPDGRVVARVDFLWKEQHTVGEFDGKVKYGRTLHPGQDVEEVLADEKIREDLIRDCDLQVARWIWRDLYRPGVIRERVLRAFARSARHG
jgi:hypothetical protein